MLILSRLKFAATPLFNLLFACVIGGSTITSATATTPETPLPQGVAQDWYGGIQKNIGASEYHVTLQQHGLQAPNRGQNLRTWFDESGAISASRTAESPGSAPWQWGLKLTRYGWKDGAMEYAQPAQPQPNDNTVTYQRGASLREWYVNGPDGVKSWFELKEKPADTGETLRLELGIRGNTLPRQAYDAQGITFTTPDGVEVINYNGLKAWDANGVPLTGSLGTDGTTVFLDIEAGKATFPVTIDPMASTIGWTAEGDQAQALFGTSVASAGDVNGDGFSDVLVGAPSFDNGQTNEGRVFIYLGSPSGLGSTVTWSAESNQAEAGFGTSVASAGDINRDGYADVIIGAPNFDNGQTDEGRAFVYLGSAFGLAATPAWTAESDQASAGFAHVVASAGDVNGDGYADVIVGAPKYDNGQTDEGRAYVFMGSASGLATAAAWTGESNQADAQFGSAAASTGDVNRDGFSDIIVGALKFDNGQTNEGRAFVFMGSVAGVSSTAAWTAESDQANADFGLSVASAGDVNGDGYSDVIVSAPSYPFQRPGSGRVFVYYGSSTGLAPTAAWIADSDSVSYWFGRCVASAGDVNGDGYSDILVGSHAQNGEGLAYVYLGSATGPASTPIWAGQSNQLGSDYGFSVASAGDINGDGYSDFIVGARYYSNGQASEGRAYVYMGNPSGLAFAAARTVESNQSGCYFGFSVASAGDVNGDDYSDIIVGAHEFDNGQNNEGRAFVYLGSAAGLATVAAWTAEGDQAVALFGMSVASAGDVNNDGYSDVIVGAPGYGTQPFGGAFVYLGSSGGLSSTPASITVGEQSATFYGQRVASAGDVNGDGFSDVVVGAPRFTQGTNLIGCVYIYLGSPLGVNTVPVFTNTGTTDLTKLGHSVASAGDVNGDGYSDVIASSERFNTVNGVRLYLGSASGPVLSGWLPVTGSAISDFSYVVASAGDVNADGYSDVIIGAPFTDNGQVSEGAVYLYMGSASGLATTPVWTVESNETLAYFGSSLASAGDVNGDGFSDVVVGAYLSSNGENNEGRAYLYMGSETGLASIPWWNTEGAQESALLGFSVASAGDINGDGYSDVIIGAPLFDNDQVDEGRVFLFMGYGLPADKQIVINEFMSNPEGDDNGNRSEWIELYNKSSQPVDLSGYKVQGNQTGTPAATSILPAGTVIAPKDFLILAAHKISFARGQYQRIDETKVVDLGWPYVSVLENGAGYISITRPGESQPLHRINYSSQAPWPGIINSDQTLELKAPHLTPKLGSNWSRSSQDTSGSPLRPNPSLNKTNISITGGVRNIQYPATTSTITVTANIIANQRPASIQLMVDTGSGYSAIPMSQISGTSYIAMIPPVASGTLVKHYVKVTAASGYYKTQPPFHPEVFFVDNNFAGAADLAITEIMYNPTGIDNAGNSEWIEIFNRRSTPINLSYFVWGPTVDNNGNRVMPEGTIIPANGHLVLAGQKGQFTTQYPIVPPGLVIDAEWAPSSKLADDADGTREVPLVHPNAVDWNNTRLAFDKVPYAISSPWPAAAEGESIYLIQTYLDANELGTNWRSAGPGNESPAATNTQSRVKDWSVY